MINVLVLLFQHVFTYPVLNLLIALYQITHNFVLAIIFFCCLANVLLFWPAGYIDELLQRQEYEARARATIGGWITRPWMYYSMSGSKRMILALAQVVLSILRMYLNVGLFFALATLSGFSQASLNGVLFVFHLSTLPDYTFMFLGQTTSLVQRGFLLTLLPVMALYTLVDACLRADAIARVSDAESRWSKAISLFGQSFLLSFFIALLLSWVLAAGVFLALVIDGLMRIPVRIYIIIRSGVWRNAEMRSP
jgi:hypothetical protein